MNIVFFNILEGYAPIITNQIMKKKGMEIKEAMYS